ncbi:hypothetical protein ACIRF8_15365 [Streptomyces sp. NPDC102406]
MSMPWERYDGSYTSGWDKAKPKPKATKKRAKPAKKTPKKR